MPPVVKKRTLSTISSEERKLNVTKKRKKLEEKVSDVNTKEKNSKNTPATTPCDKKVNNSKSSSGDSSNDIKKTIKRHGNIKSRKEKDTVPVENVSSTSVKQVQDFEDNSKESNVNKTKRKSKVRSKKEEEKVAEVEQLLNTEKKSGEQKVNVKKLPSKTVSLKKGKKLDLPVKIESMNAEQLPELEEKSKKQKVSPSKKPSSVKSKRKDTKTDIFEHSNSSSLSVSKRKFEKINSEKKDDKNQSVCRFNQNEIQRPSVEDVNNMDVTQLLALGETKGENVGYNETYYSDNSDDSSNSDVSDFEEVKNVDSTEPIIPKDGVNITLDAPNLYNKRKKKGIDLEAHLKRQMNRVKKDMQYLMHKVHVLCWLAHLKFVNNTLNNELIMKTCLTLVKSKNLYPSKYSDLSYLEEILKWFHKNIKLTKNVEDPECTGGLLKELTYQLEKKQAFSCRAFILTFIALLRVLGLKARIVMSFQVLHVRPTIAELYDPKGKKGDQAKSEANCSKAQVPEEKVVREESDGNCEEKSQKTSEKRKSTNNKSNGPKNKKKTTLEDSEDENSDDDFESVHFRPSLKSSSESKKGKDSKKVKTNKKNKKNQKEGVLNGTDSENEDDDFKADSLKKKEIKKKPNKKSSEKNDESKKKEGSDIWTEVYLEAEEKWISVDVPRQKVHCVGELYSRATHPVVYVIAGNNDLTMKDVTKRYVPNWHSDTRKKRVDEEWWNETMKPYLPRKTAQDKEEDEDINRQLSDKPLPASISEFKDHPLYALKRHLLKFEGIYPPDAPTLGFVRGEPVYARECVVTLRSREIWYKEARVVRLKEEPYKIVKARPKYDKMTGEIKKDLPLELFGFWQTEPYIPPIAVGGKVPRNEYGNVDLFKPCMLPIGTVHLPIPGLIRVAKKLGIDCAPATVGFEFHSGGSHPVFDGFVVCEEFKETLLDTWNKEIDESAKRNEERKEKRVYGNWKRLIRGLLIREKLKIKYAFGEHSDEEPSTSKASPPKSS